MTTSFQQRAETALRLLRADLSELRIPDTDDPGYDPERLEQLDQVLCDDAGCLGPCLRDDKVQELADVTGVINATIDALQRHLTEWARDRFHVDLKAGQEARRG